MVGPNVVVKGPPYLPYVRGDTICDDVVNDECAATGTCVSCDTFNQAGGRRSELSGSLTRVSGQQLARIYARARRLHGRQTLASVFF